MQEDRSKIMNSSAFSWAVKEPALQQAGNVVGLPVL
jgi:hypothetical protein